MSAQFFNMILITTLFEYMLNGPLQVHGTFYLFGACCLAGTLFFIIFLKETKGLTDLEKKTLYSPVNKVLEGVELEEISQSPAT